MKLKYPMGTGEMRDALKEAVELLKAQDNWEEHQNLYAWNAKRRAFLDRVTEEPHCSRAVRQTMTLNNGDVVSPCGSDGVVIVDSKVKSRLGETYGPDKCPPPIPCPNCHQEQDGAVVRVTHVGPGSRCADCGRKLQPDKTKTCRQEVEGMDVFKALIILADRIDALEKK